MKSTESKQSLPLQSEAILSKFPQKLSHSCKQLPNVNKEIFMYQNKSFITFISHSPIPFVLLQDFVSNSF